MTNPDLPINDAAQNDAAEYIQRRIRRALADKTLRDLRGTLSRMEAEELAERKVLGRLALVTLAILIILPACLALYRALQQDRPATTHEVILSGPAQPGRNTAGQP